MPGTENRKHQPLDQRILEGFIKLLPTSRTQIHYSSLFTQQKRNRLDEVNFDDDQGSFFRPIVFLLYPELPRTKTSVVNSKLRVKTMFRYEITESEVAVKAVEEISSRIGSEPPSRAASPLQLISMKEKFDLELLTQFYNEVMIPNFPLEEERDDLEDWIYCMDPSKKQNTSQDQSDPYPSMDVLLIVKREMPYSIGKTTIVAGVAFEYYKQAQCGLLSYMVVPNEFRKLGVMKSLHPVACHAMQLLHQEHATASNFSVSPFIRAIFAETNTPEAGDVPPSVIRKRHETLYRLGYRHLKFPYIQPALGEDAKSFDEIILLIYEPNNDSTSSSTTKYKTIETEILKDYIVDFFQSVAGYDNEGYKQDWYYQLVEWFGRENTRTEIAQGLPWDDITDAMKERKAQSIPSGSSHVTVIGAGIAGLVATVTLAEEYLKVKEDKTSSDNDVVKPLTITLIEAQPFVGGRIRTVVTKESETQPHPFVFSNDQLPDSRNVHGFAPWPVSIGAEFVHGVDSMANELIEDHEEWMVHETFDLCESPEEYPARNSFVQRRSSISLSEEQRKEPHVGVFMDGKFCPTQDRPAGSQNDTDSTSDTNKIRESIRRASHIWQSLQSISEELSSTTYSKNGVKYGRDMSLDDFVHVQLSDGEENLTGEEIERIKNMLECMYSNTAGTSNKFLGIQEASREEWNWEYTESNFRLEKCFNEFVQYYLDRITKINDKSVSSNLGIQINMELSCPVSEIGNTSQIESKDNNASIQIFTKTDKSFVCDKCIVAVPLGVLKANKINFRDTYKIPPEIQEGIDTINMFSGMKAHMLLKVGVDIQRISKRMKNIELLFCPGEIFSQVWLRRNEETVFLSGFCVANCRDKLMQIVQSREESKSTIAQELMLDQVQRIFESTDSKEEKIFTVSSSPTCSSFALHDWSEDEFTLGIYSSPSVGAGWSGNLNDEFLAGDVLPPTHRDRLAKPINNQIWFSGEHANTETCATVQSAMESGARAAKEVFKALVSA